MSSGRHDVVGWKRRDDRSAAVISKRQRLRGGPHQVRPASPPSSCRPGEHRRRGVDGNPPALGRSSGGGKHACSRPELNNRPPLGQVAKREALPSLPFAKEEPVG